MNIPKLPQTDSIQELAEFWDTHDLTEFEGELEDVAEQVFVRGSTIKVPLGTSEIELIEQMAQAEDVPREELVRTWVLQRLTHLSHN